MTYNELTPWAKRAVDYHLKWPLVLVLVLGIPVVAFFNMFHRYWRDIQLCWHEVIMFSKVDKPSG